MCNIVSMSNQREQRVLNEIEEIRNLEWYLRLKWTQLNGAGTDERSSFLSSVRELDRRTAQLEQLLSAAASSSKRLRRAA